MLRKSSCYVILDTGAVLKLYEQEKGDLLLCKLEGSEVVIPGEVISELERQRDCKRTKEDGKTLLCPYELTNALYVSEGYGRFTRLNAAPTNTEQNQIRNAMARATSDGNSRIGKGDFAVINAAMALREPAYTVIVSSDSDIPTILSGLGLDIGFLLPEDYWRCIRTA